MPTIGGFVLPTGGSPAESRTTLLDIVDELARPINADDTDVKALAADAFRAAVRRMNRNLWPWEVVSEDITITANAVHSSVSSAIKKPLSMHFLSAAGGVEDQEIVYYPFDRFIETSDLNLTGEPSSYTIPNLFETGQIRWFPIPTSNDNARLWFYRMTPAPRLDNEAVEIPDHALEVYKAIAWAEFLKRLPPAQRSFDLAIAIAESRQAFRELSAHVQTAGDRTRYGAYWR